MPPLQKALAGQFNLNDWFEQGDNEATIEQLLTALLPVQDMAPHQRRIRTLPKTAGAIQTLIGEFGLMAGTVPAGETWRMLWAGVLFTDAVTTSHAVLLRIIPATPADTAFIIVRRQVSTGISTPLYPGNPQRPLASSDNNFAVQTGPPVDLFPGDAIQIFDTTAVGAATGTFAAFFRYEVLPPPVLFEADDIIAVTS